MSATRFLRLAVLPAAAASTILAAGCGGQPTTGGSGHQVVLVERDRANGTTVHASVGDKVVVILGSTYWQFSAASGDQRAPPLLRGGPDVPPLAAAFQPDRRRQLGTARLAGIGSGSTRMPVADHPPCSPGPPPRSGHQRHGTD